MAAKAPSLVHFPLPGHSNRPAQDAIIDVDAPLVRTARDGNAESFTELVNRHYGFSLKLARSILHNLEDAEDEVQNAFIKVHLHLNRFEGNSRFSTWLNRIVVNQCLMRLRKGRRTRFAYLDDPGTEDGATVFELTDHADTPEQSLGRSEVGAILRREVKAIPPLLREPLLLRESARLSLTEVAETLKITEAAAKSRLLRARRELRARLLRHQGQYGPATLLT